MAGFASDVLGGIYRTYVLKNVIRDTSNLARRAWRNRDDADYFLNKLGLSTYSPVKETFFGLSLFLLGAIGGGLLALSLAPMRGQELRAEVKDRARQLIDRANAQVRQPEMRA